MIIVAVSLALVGSVAFAIAAVLQGRAVRGAAGGRGLGPRTWLQAARRPAWIGGVLCSLVGAAVAVVALSLAPVSLIQPIGVLALPFAVLLSARLAGVRPSGRAWSASALCVSGVLLVVIATAHGGATAPIAGSAALLPVGGVLVLVAGLAALGSLGPPRWQCPANAAAAATCFGAMCVLVKITADVYTVAGLGGLATPDAVVMIIGLLAAGGTGAWLCQRAYAVGSPEVVLGCLTVLDPLVAVILGRLLLGEATHQGVVGGALLVVGGTAALTGVIRLSRLHPAVHARRRDQPSGPAPATASHSRDHRLERTPA